MSRVTELASGQINGRDTITIELIEADGAPAVIIVRWPARPTVLKRGRVIIYSQPAHSAVTARTCVMRPYGIKRKGLHY